MTLTVNPTSLAPAIPQPPSVNGSGSGGTGAPQRQVTRPDAIDIVSDRLTTGAETAPDLHQALQSLIGQLPDLEPDGPTGDDAVRLMALNIQQGLSGQTAPIVSAQGGALLNLFRA